MTSVYLRLSQLFCGIFSQTTKFIIGVYNLHFFAYLLLLIRVPQIILLTQNDKIPSENDFMSTKSIMIGNLALARRAVIDEKE